MNMDMCLLCLQLKQESSEGIEVTSMQWKEKNIENLIEKHFWPLKSIMSNSWLCKNCWAVLNEFHTFYTRIEDAHLYFVSMLKTELLEGNDEMGAVVTTNLSTLETSVKDTPNEKELIINLDEEEKPLDIKTEINHEELPIPAEIEVQGKTRHKRDPLEKPYLPKNRKARKIGKYCKEKQEDKSEVISAEQTVELKEKNTDVNITIGENPNSSPADFDDDYKNTSDSDNEAENNETPVAADWKPRSNSYYKPRTKRNDLDEFLATNFNITCIICQAPMQTFHELCKHSAKIHNKRGYVVCCNKKFLRRSVLVDHIHRHLDPEYFKCKKCGKLMSDRRCLDLHVKNHEKQDKTHVCDICGKAFSGQTHLKNHKLIHLSDEEKKFPCEECGKPFGNIHLLSSHVRVVHLNKYALVCDICGKKMRSKDVFERHILRHKGVPVPTISCDICGIKMTNQRGLKHHKATQHPEGGKKEYPCHICSKISPTLGAHKRHVQYKHELGYDFKCTMCDKAFKRSCSLREHMATHTGTVLYTCPYCPKTFNSNANMHSHRKKAHPKEWEEAHRAKYTGNLPPNNMEMVANDIQNDNDIPTMKWF